MVAVGRQAVSTPRPPFRFPFSFSSSPSSNPPRRRGRCTPQWVRRGPRRRGVRLGGTGHGRRARRGGGEGQGRGEWRR